MKEYQIILELNKYEKGILINALNEFRNSLINRQKDTENIDELLLKILDAPEKKRYFHPNRIIGSR